MRSGNKANVPTSVYVCVCVCTLFKLRAIIVFRARPRFPVFVSFSSASAVRSFRKRDRPTGHYDFVFPERFCLIQPTSERRISGSTRIFTRL